MELLEIGNLLFALVEMCGCFLEFMAVGSSAGAIATGVKAGKETKARRAATKAGNEAPTAPLRWWLLFGLLTFLAAFLLGLVVLKWWR